jgi:hypothetical protein
VQGDRWVRLTAVVAALVVVGLAFVPNTLLDVVLKAVLGVR